MEDLVIYQGPRYLNTAPRKQYVVELGYIDWNTVRADVCDFNHTFSLKHLLNRMIKMKTMVQDVFME